MEDQFVERKRIGFFGLPWTFTKYYIREDMITVESGLFSVTENDCYMYKVQDVELKRSFWERIFGTGTVICFTGDTTSQVLTLRHIKHAREVKNFILEFSEKERLRRRTLNTLNIGAGGHAGHMHDVEDVSADGYYDDCDHPQLDEIMEHFHD